MMLEESEDPAVKSVQPTLKSGRKWKVSKAVNLAKQCLNTEEVIGQTQTDRKGLGWTSTKLWSKTEGKDKRDMVIQEVKYLEEESRFQKAVQQPLQGQWTNW